MAIEVARPYIVPIDISTGFTVAIDIFEIIPFTAKPVMLLGWEFGQLSEVGDAQEEWLDLRLRYYNTVGTTGTGGSTPTARATTPNSSNFAGTVKIGNTTKYTGGTPFEMARVAWNVRQTCLYIPLVEERIVADVAKPLVLDIVVAPADIITGIKGRIVIGELI